MSRRPVKLEDADSDSDAFDDDTDLPLPSKALPNTGTRGALLEEIDIEMSSTSPAEAPPRLAPPSRQAPRPATGAVPGGSGAGGRGLMDPSHPLYQQFLAANRAAGGGREPETIDPSSPEMEKYKKWTCIYPIYMDAKRAYGTGQRRIAREKSVWWPKSDDILTAVASLRLPVLHEPQKAHPRDWENPGRVKVQWKQDDGRFTNPAIPTKKKLFEMIAAYIQRSKPDQVPDMSALSIKDDEKPAETIPSSLPAKPAKGKDAKGKAAASAAASARQARRRRPPLPKPPLPLPSLQERYTPYSPLIPSGALLEGWKVGTADKAAEGAATPGAGAGGAAKGKRKIIRIRQ